MYCYVIHITIDNRRHVHAWHLVNLQGSSVKRDHHHPGWPLAPNWVLASTEQNYN